MKKQNILLVLLLLSVAANVWLLCREGTPAPAAQVVVVTRDTVRVVDTVLVRHPVARDTAAAQTFVTARLPRVKDTADTSTPPPDTVAVRLPIVQRVYADSTYTAWVSGYRATLDSIAVYRRRETVTVQQTAVTATTRRRRWDIGLQAGYGLTPRGPQPYVGIGLTWHPW